MGFLELPPGALAGSTSITRATISLWFRIPKTSLDATAAAWRGDPKVPFDGITPLVVFGDDTMAGYTTKTDFFLTAHRLLEVWNIKSLLDPSPYPYVLRFPPSNYDLYGYTNVKDVTVPKNPCYIGVDCNREAIESWDPDDGEPEPLPNVLRIRLQMSDLSTTSGWTYNRTNSTCNHDNVQLLSAGPHVDIRRNASPPQSFGPDVLGHTAQYVPEYNPFIVTNDMQDVSDVSVKAETEWFDVFMDRIEVKPDHWHHIIVSFDLTGTVEATGVQVPSGAIYPDIGPDHGSVSSTCRIFVSFDDKNVSGSFLRKSFDNDYVTSRLEFGPNDLVTENAINVALTRVPANGLNGGLGVLAFTGQIGGIDENGWTVPTYEFSPGGISSHFNLGIPATKKYVNNIHKCEMAEFQMWVNPPSTLDTANVLRRRLFVDAAGYPVPPEVAEDTLGEPAITLHKCKNWIKGLNTGYEGQNQDGTVNPVGQFAPTGDIKCWKPDPSLHGPQSPKDVPAPAPAEAEA